MIFSTEHIAMIRAGSKTRTSRLVQEHEFLFQGGVYKMTMQVTKLRSVGDVYKKWISGHTYTIQPGRGKHGQGKIVLGTIVMMYLNDLTADQIKEEGYDNVNDFIDVWNSIHPDHPWESNPEVWSITFSYIGGD